MAVKSSVSANHINTKSNGIGEIQVKHPWYARNAVKRKHCLLILILILEDMKKMTEYVKRSDVIKIMEDNSCIMEVFGVKKK